MEPLGALIDTWPDSLSRAWAVHTRNYVWQDCHVDWILSFFCCVQGFIFLYYFICRYALWFVPTCPHETMETCLLLSPRPYHTEIMNSTLVFRSRRMLKISHNLIHTNTDQLPSVFSVVPEPWTFTSIINLDPELPTWLPHIEHSKVFSDDKNCAEYVLVSQTRSCLDHKKTLQGNLGQYFSTILHLIITWISLSKISVLVVLEVQIFVDTVFHQILRSPWIKHCQQIGLKSGGLEDGGLILLSFALKYNSTLPWKQVLAV